jgi:hypothetical protein
MNSMESVFTLYCCEGNDIPEEESQCIDRPYISLVVILQLFSGMNQNAVRFIEQNSGAKMRCSIISNI